MHDGSPGFTYSVQIVEILSQSIVVVRSGQFFGRLVIGVDQSNGQLHVRQVS